MSSLWVLFTAVVRYPYEEKYKDNVCSLYLYSKIIGKRHLIVWLPVCYSHIFLCTRIMAELTLEKCQSFYSAHVREELNSILLDRSALNLSHLEVIIV